MTAPTPRDIAGRPKHNVAVRPVVLTAPAKQPRKPHRSVLVTRTDDGIRKAKALVPGQRVQAWFQGEARGSVRVVESVERIEDNTMVRIAFSSGHPTQDYKPAYRFIDLDAVGCQIEVRETVVTA